MNLPAITLAAALEVLSPAPAGKTWTAVCVWCLEKIDPQHVHPARRAAAGGDCLSCPYTGRDVFVACLPLETT